MIDVEPLIEESFARLYPTPAVTPRWPDVLARTGGRATRRRAVAVAIALAVLVIPLIALGATRGWWLDSNPPKPESGIVVVRTGRWDGVPWALTAFGSRDSFCFGLTPNLPAYAKREVPSCAGGIAPRSPAEGAPPSGEFHWVSYLASGGSADFPAWVAGPTTPEVAGVDVVLDSGETIRTTTFPAPPELLGPKLRFYVARFPCGHFVAALTPKDRRGRVLEHWVLWRPSLPGRMVCGR